MSKYETIADILDRFDASINAINDLDLTGIDQIELLSKANEIAPLFIEMLGSGASAIRYLLNEQLDQAAECLDDGGNDSKD